MQALQILDISAKSIRMELMDPYAAKLNTPEHCRIFQGIGSELSMNVFTLDNPDVSLPSYVQYLLNFSADFYPTTLGDAEPDEQIATRQKVAEVRVTLSTLYRIAEGTAVPEEKVLLQYGQTNCVLHTWPFWREVLLNACERMNIPRAAVPVLPFKDIQKGIADVLKNENGESSAKS